MVRTLRITGVAAVALAGVVLASVLGPASLIHLGGQSDKQMEKTIAGPSAVERFREQHGDKDQGGQDTTPPLVKQAEDFRNIIDPPPPAGPTNTGQTASIPRPPNIKPPPVTSQKFDLVGTSYSQSDPQSSFAYIRLPDDTHQWVKVGSQVGHVVIKEIRKGSIICWDGRNASPMTVEPVPSAASLLEVNRSAPPRASSQAPQPQPVEVKIIEPRRNPTRFPGRPTASRAREIKPKMTEDEMEALGDLVNKFKELNEQTGGAPLDQAAASELISEYKSSRVSPQETKKLENLGEESGTEKDAAREERKREFLKRFNTPRSSKN